MEGFLYVPNLERWQHYKDRSPPWIKLHRDMLNDYKFSRLQDASKAHLIQIWMLASQMDNRLPPDAEWIGKRINATEEVDLKLLIDGGFLSADSEALANRLQSAIREAEAKAEAEDKNINVELDSEPSGVKRANGVPYQKIAELWAEMLPELPQPVKLTDARKAQIRARWNDELPDLDAWRECFALVRASPFLMGKVAPRSGYKRMFCTLDFITKQANVVKLYEGYYDGKA